MSVTTGGPSPGAVQYRVVAAGVVLLGAMSFMIAPEG
jgi:hypothetical protein